jgi:hypothetical protein
MNRLFFLPLFALILTANSSWGYIVPQIWVESQALEAAGYKDGEGIRQHLQGVLMEAIEKAFPCVSMISRDDANTILKFVRERQSISPMDTQSSEALQADLQELSGASKARFYILVQVNGIKETAEMTVNFRDRREEKNNITLMRRVSGPGDATFGPNLEMAQELVREMAYLEICPYTGPMTLTVNSSRKKDETSEYPISCPSIDGMYKRWQQEEVNVLQHWRLQRTGKPDTSGEMTATIYENREDREENSCYPCTSGRKGGRTNTKTTTIKAEVNGLSTRSRVMGEPENHDATVRLTFDRNGTYSIAINGTSTAANYRGKTQETTEGTCDLVNKSADLSEDQINTLIKYNRSLPLTVPKTSFSGTAFDKRLTGKKEIPLHDPTTNEQATITLEFDLQRK